MGEGNRFEACPDSYRQDCVLFQLYCMVLGSAKPVRAIAFIGSRLVLTDIVRVLSSFSSTAWFEACPKVCYFGTTLGFSDADLG